jgi:DNA-binding MarR family transcriptional regulator
MSCTAQPPSTAEGDRLPAMLELAMDGLFRLRGVLDPTQIAAGLGMSVSEALALRYLTAGQCTQHVLGNYLGLEKSTVSRLVDAMVSKGWLQKEHMAGNRRYRTLVLTAAGAEAAISVSKAMRHRHQQMLTSLTAEEHQALAIALPALMRALSKQDHGRAGASGEDGLSA